MHEGVRVVLLCYCRAHVCNISAATKHHTQSPRRSRTSTHARLCLFCTAVFCVQVHGLLRMGDTLRADGDAALQSLGITQLNCETVRELLELRVDYKLAVAP